MEVFLLAFPTGCCIASIYITCRNGSRYDSDISLKKKDVIKKNPSAYNLFIKEAMTKLKEDEPELKNKELLKRATKLWQEEKSKKK